MISIRIDPNIELVKETIKENFLKEPLNIEVTYNTKQFEIRVSEISNRWTGDKFLFALQGCKYEEIKNGAFLTLQIRQQGYPNTTAITLPHHFIKKLRDNKIDFEIW